MTKEDTFRVGVRLLFIVCYASFLWASIHHVATFFHNFERDGTDWASSYMLAASIDVTSLVMTFAAMFFRKSMPRVVFGFLWLFIALLTSFSWFVNWEYASRYQNIDLTTDPLLLNINPILASSFAFMNLVYALVGEFFGTKKKTADQLKAEADDLEATAIQQARIDAVRRSQGDSKLDGLFDALGKAKDRAKELTRRGQNQDFAAPKEDPKPEVREGQNDAKTDDLQELKDDSCEPVSGEIVALSGDALEALNRYPKIERLLAGGRPTFSIAEVSEATGHGIKFLANRISNGDLKHPPRSVNRITRESLLTWLKTAPLPRQSNNNNVKIVAFKTGSM